MVNLDPLRDEQDTVPLDYCERCGGELYGGEAEPDGDGRVYCPECRAEIAEAGAKSATILMVLEAVDGELKKYLSDDLRNTVWNTMVKKFPIKEAG